MWLVEGEEEDDDEEEKKEKLSALKHHHVLYIGVSLVGFICLLVICTQERTKERERERDQDGNDVVDQQLLRNLEESFEVSSNA